MASAKKQLSRARPGDLAILIGRDRKPRIVRLQPGQKLETHRGVLPHDDLIGKPWGSQVLTHLEHAYTLLRPSLNERILHLRRISQIVYPKEAGYILLKMSIGPGARVIEAGTGSGALTLVLAHAVRPDGRVYSYEVRPDMQDLARRNIERAGLSDGVEFKLRDVTDGFDETGVDALFLDLPTPWDVLQQAHAALINGGFFGTILPTANQVSRLLESLPQFSFGHPEVEEVLLRPYKPVAARLRPADQMVAHTGFLVFARTLISADETRVESGDDVS
jgi:tRNA (adenine57-N1/adenine58-N1)-methyltransferase